MGLDPSGCALQIPEAERLNMFALVVYIPDPLGQFLDDLRRELVPEYKPHAHVSVLPPRSLEVDWQTACEQVRGLTEAWMPFDVELTRVDIFPATDVVYVEVGAGAEELYRLHSAMNTGALKFDEPYPYHPHITLAQDVLPEHKNAVTELAQRRWREFRGPRIFRAERAVFVQNTMSHCWIDLAEYSLGVTAVR
jgi:2'-5' RNA ligase